MDQSRTSNTVLIERSKGGYLFLAPDDRNECFHFFTVEYDIGCRFVIYGLYYIELCSLYTHFLESFYH